MTLDEAIKHAEEKAEDLRKEGIIKQNRNNTDESILADRCIKCAEEHEQLAEWLKELKAYKEQTDGDLISRDYAIEQIKKAQENGYVFTYDTLIDFVKVLPTIPHIIITKEDIEKANKILENKDFWKINDKAVELLNKQINSIDTILEEIKEEIEKEKTNDNT